MNVKKLVSGFFVALLAAALFVGAGAAADGTAADGIPTVFVYEYNSAYDGTWYNEDTGESITFAGHYLTGNNIKEGTYKNSTADNAASIYVRYPDARIEATVNGVSVIDGTVPDNAKITFTLSGLTEKYKQVYNTTKGNFRLSFINPDGVRTFHLGDAGTVIGENQVEFQLTSAVDAGEWQVQAYFAPATGNAEGQLVSTTPDQYKYGKTLYKFTVTDTDNEISISTDSVILGNSFTVTVEGYPGNWVRIYCEDEDASIKAVAGQPNVIGIDKESCKLDETDTLEVDEHGIYVKIADNGKKTVALKAEKEDGKFTIKSKFYVSGVDLDGTSYKVLENNKDNLESSSAKTAKITVIEGAISISAEQDFYYLGNDVDLFGTNTETDDVYLYIKGSNVDFQELKDGNDIYKINVNSDNSWDEEIDGVVFDNFDAGTYTIYAVAVNLQNEKTANTEEYGDDDLEDIISDFTYATASLVLKQPFLNAELSAPVVAQASDLTISGNAEAADKIMFYVFGNNKFTSGTITVEDDGTFEEDIDIDEDEYATGQYFVVLQHPMYDGVFNIGPIEDDTVSEKVGNKDSYNIVLNTKGSYEVVDLDNESSKILFNTLNRQSANAAEALCQALDTQNIDDVYVKAAFIVATPTASMNPVSDVAKGSKLVVSGTSNMAEGEVVTVEMLSTAFAAIPKESVNSASFMSLVTKVQEDGTWEVTFDTTGLNVDEYTLSATVGDIKTSAVIVKVTEGAPVTPPADDKPDTPVDPVTPPTEDPKEEPETPGFGALAALAGLGAVAVLLLRRE